MAQVFVKNRLEPIELENERAIIVKRNWLDPQKPKTDICDIEMWAGEYGLIKAVELDKLKPIVLEKPNQEDIDRREAENFKNMPPEEKAKFIGRADFNLLKLSGMTFRLKDNPEAIKDVIKLQCEYYTNNPDSLSVPPDEYKPVIQKFCK